MTVPHGALHHVELWVPDLVRATSEWGPLMCGLGYAEYQRWEHGISWRLGTTYLVLEQSPALAGERHDRMLPGLNHLAFHVRDAASVDDLVEVCLAAGWTLLFPDRHPHAGGPDQYAGYLANSDGYEVELVAG